MEATNMASVQPMWKTSRTATKKAKLKIKRETKADENKNKAKVRRRDRGCRFPLCGCRKLGLKLDARREVSHDIHKGMGGNPAGDRSTTALMVQLCGHRHQDGRISRHKGTMRARHLTPAGYDGPVAWEIDIAMYAYFVTLDNGADALSIVMPKTPIWREVARERVIGVLEPLTGDQHETLDILAEMDL
jgi:hypothetical protein